MPITVQIFWNTAEQQKKAEMGVEIEDPIESADLKTHTFYQIAFIRPYGEYCEIGSNGEIYVANASYENVMKGIEIQSHIGFN